MQTCNVNWDGSVKGSFQYLGSSPESSWLGDNGKWLGHIRILRYCRSCVRTVDNVSREVPEFLSQHTTALVLVISMTIQVNRHTGCCWSIYQIATWSGFYGFVSSQTISWVWHLKIKTSAQSGQPKLAGPPISNNSDSHYNSTHKSITLDQLLGAYNMAICESVSLYYPSSNYWVLTSNDKL